MPVAWAWAISLGFYRPSMPLHRQVHVVLDNRATDTASLTVVPIMSESARRYVSVVAFIRKVRRMFFPVHGGLVMRAQRLVSFGAAAGGLAPLPDFVWRGACLTHLALCRLWWRHVDNRGAAPPGVWLTLVPGWVPNRLAASASDHRRSALC